MKLRYYIIVFILMSFNLYAKEDCTNKCHKEIGKKKFVHGPVGAFICSPCHSVSGKPTGTHKATLKIKGSALCYSCHDEMKGKLAKKHMHEPVSKNCSICHDPHQSNSKYHLKGKTVAALCTSCHTKQKPIHKYKHKPLADGDCNACHDPHSSEHKKLLVASYSKLCFNCHKDKIAELKRKYVHKPIKEGCHKCHDPHQSPNKDLLYASSPSLCFRCHQKTRNQIAQVRVPHDPVKKGQCQTCHISHSSNFKALLKSKITDICFTCHEALGKQVKKAKFKHGPVKTNNCYECHKTHGSKYLKLLSLPFPKEFYPAPYDPKKFAICFRCHNKSNIRNKYTTTLTGFRNGNLNLHYLHVNRKDKPRSCKACHEVHAGIQARHIRTEVPFGKSNWMLPINFTKKLNGGNCVVGCHKSKEYNRVKPVKY